MVSCNMRVAAIQMDVTPAPVMERLARAELLVARAAQAGARLVVLPEVFNTGYAYMEDNYGRAELSSGPTATWLRRMAAQYQIHLAGSWLQLDPPEIYNALWICAPDGACWRYDKTYPWSWERAYFRGGDQGPVVAHTAIGDIGLLICWDVAHPELWRRYAGRVTLMVICSSPPDIPRMQFAVPGETGFRLDETPPFLSRLRNDATLIFGSGVDQQTAWLGVPAIATGGCGTFHSAIPDSRGSFLALGLLAPQQLNYFPQAEQLRGTCGMVEACKIVAADGEVLAHLPQAAGETVLVADILLNDAPSKPAKAQPRRRVSLLSYMISDLIIPLLTTSLYRRGVKRCWGMTPAPWDRLTRSLAWGGIVAAISALIAWLGWRAWIHK